MVDLDFIVIEYAQTIPVALIEYKHESATFDIRHANYIALTKLANRKPPLPIFIVRYMRDPWEFLMIPLNALAKHCVKTVDWLDPVNCGRWCSEYEYVTILHRMRGKAVPDDMFDQLGNLIPKAERARRRNGTSQLPATVEPEGYGERHSGREKCGTFGADPSGGDVRDGA